MEQIIDLALLTLWIVSLTCMIPIGIIALVDDPENGYKISFILLAIVFVFITLYDKHGRIQKYHTVSREVFFEKDFHNYVTDPTYKITSTVDNRKYTSTDSESMEKVLELVHNQAIDDTEIKNNTLQIYYSKGKRVDIKIKQLDDYYKKYD